MTVFESDIALPLFVSNFVTLALIVFFGQDRYQQRTAYKEQVARLEAQSLKAQMNPHFIYNTLNGIQSVMLLKGEEKANEYIGIFSKMLRITMEMSTEEILSLSDELNYLKTYIVLQNIRLEFPIRFDVWIDHKIDIDCELISPMLLQPIIENAIIHGIIPLKSKGQIYLRIFQKEDSLKFLVEDNGIGRKASQQLKTKYKNPHRSLATKLLKERIDIYNYLRKTRSMFYLEDIVVDNKIAGTRAVLVIPRNLKKNLSN